MTAGQRPQRPRGDKVRNKILKSAKKLFSKQGFAGTSTVQIAAKAGVHQSLIFHHFGNKAKLWTAVKQAAVAEHGIDWSKAAAATLDEFLERVIESRYQLRQCDPDMVRIIGWQQMERGKNNSLVKQALQVESTLEMVKELQQRNEIRADLDPRDVVSLLIIVVDATTQPCLEALYPEGMSGYIQFLKQQLPTILQA